MDFRMHSVLRLPRKSSSYCHARPRDLVQRTIIARLSTYKFHRITRDSVGRSECAVNNPAGWKTAQGAMNFQGQIGDAQSTPPPLPFSSLLFCRYVGGHCGRGRSTLVEFEDRPVSAHEGADPVLPDARIPGGGTRIFFVKEKEGGKKRPREKAKRKRNGACNAWKFIR